MTPEQVQATIGVVLLVIVFAYLWNLGSQQKWR